MIRKSVFAACCAAGFLGAGAGSAEAFTILLKGRANLCAEVLDNKLQAGAPIVLGACNSEQENQSFAMDARLGGVWVVDDKNVNLCVDAAEGAPLALRECDKVTVVWRYKRTGSLASDTGLCWEVAQNRQAAGTALIAAKCQAGPGQAFSANM
ncbi:MAG: Ricin-type beta-trefoil lectin protein [Hyphomicrobiales bacterium]|nr:Ricin-type beta-trefoil lectin protein [Hyphomicrobiales bacterium]